MRLALPSTRLYLLLLLTAHVFLVLREFPLASIANGGLPIKGDVARYLAGAAGTEALGGSGYDPLVMAGYSAGTWNSVGKRGYELLTRQMPGPLGLRFYAVLVASCLLLPVVAAITAARLTASSALAATVTFIVWHFDSQVAYFWHFGNALYPGTCALVPLTLACAWHAAASPRPVAAAVATGLLTAWAFHAHTVVCLVLVPPMLLLGVVLSWRRRSLWPLAGLSLAATITVMLCFQWLSELLRLRSECVPQPHAWFQAGIKHFVADLFSDRGYGRPFDRNIILHIATVAGVIGSILSARRGRPVVAFIGSAGLWCLAIAYTFSFVPGLRSVQPYRFLVPAILCLSVPAVVALREAGLIFTEAPLRARRLILALLVVIAPALTAAGLDQLQPPLPCGLTAIEAQVLADLADRPVQGRVLCEPETVALLVPFRTGHAVLGGLNDQAFVKQRFAGILADGTLFGRGPAAWSAAELSKYLDAYAVEIALFESPAWIAWAAAHPEVFTLARRIGDVTIFRVKSNVDIVAEGAAVVVRHADRLSITPQSRRLVLKYHASPLLKISPGVTAEEVRLVPDDPVPFLGLNIPEGLPPFEVRFR